MKKIYKALDVTVILVEKEDVIRTSGKQKDQGVVLIPDWNV